MQDVREKSHGCGYNLKHERNIFGFKYMMEKNSGRNTREREREREERERERENIWIERLYKDSNQSGSNPINLLI